MAIEIQRIADDSTVVGLVHAAVSQFREQLAASWLTSTGRSVENALETATDASALAMTFRTLTRWTLHSYFYRWLTKKPEPEVIVINLRETRTIGPLVVLLGRLTPIFERTWQGSLTYRVSERLRSSSKREWITESRTVQLLVVALEPPEPPGED